MRSTCSASARREQMHRDADRDGVRMKNKTTRRIRPRPDRRPADRPGAGAGGRAVCDQGADSVRQQGAAAQRSNEMPTSASATATGIRTLRCTAAIRHDRRCTAAARRHRRARPPPRADAAKTLGSGPPPRRRRAWPQRQRRSGPTAAATEYQHTRRRRAPRRGRLGRRIGQPPGRPIFSDRPATGDGDLAVHQIARRSVHLFRAGRCIRPRPKMQSSSGAACDAGP